MGAPDCSHSKCVDKCAKCCYCGKELPEHETVIETAQGPVGMVSWELQNAREAERLLARQADSCLNGSMRMSASEVFEALRAARARVDTLEAAR